MWRYSVIRQPEPLLSKVTEDENLFVCQHTSKPPSMFIKSLEKMKRQLEKEMVVLEKK